INGIRVIHYKPNTSWESFDTAGWKTWGMNYNDIHNHEKGAMTLYRNAPWGFGWGTYNSTTHVITGDSIYLLAWNDGSKYIKFMKFQPLKQPANGDLIFRYANVDGTNEVQDTLFQSAANSQNYKYFSFSKTKPVREPANNLWDITFNRYYEPVPTGPSTVQYYPVMGVETNRVGVKVARIIGPTWNTVLADTQNLISKHKTKTTNDLSAIGSNWKFFDNNQFKWFLSDTSSYIVKTIEAADTNWWLLHFTAFGGSGNGKSVFNKMLLGVTNSVYHPTIGTLNVFPNPATNQIWISLENSLVKNAQIRLSNIAGSTVQEMEVQNSSDFSAYSMPINNLKSGIYYLTVTSGNQKTSQKIVIQ
ncbi:MAG: T9SS type A sorting domain-containing protein, partial [Bacteroidia bacterium]|nr:T9SS type A sorting domain-containing protein [Bacteroidia bacterium]